MARTASVKLDAVSANAVDLAREALEAVTEPGQVGEHLRAEASGDRIVTHVFECTMPGYRGWSWVVVVARAPRAKAPTVSETALLPGEGALLAPEWEPWAERLKPSDVGADDLLPFTEEDARLEQGYEQTDDREADRVALWELGLGRARVLSPEGREDAAERWQGGEFGPREISARQRRGTIDAPCSTCGFLYRMSGSLGQEFGVCTNEWSPADGRVVSLAYGCGAHSETGKEEEQREEPGAGIVIDELEVEYESTPLAEDPAETAQDDAAQGDAAQDDAAQDDAATDDPAKGDAEHVAAEQPAEPESSAQPEAPAEQQAPVEQDPPVDDTVSAWEQPAEIERADAPQE